MIRLAILTYTVSTSLAALGLSVTHSGARWMDRFIQSCQFFLS
jgi:hypothetical protein